jgi:hypothetical protein
MQYFYRENEVAGREIFKFGKEIKIWKWKPSETTKERLEKHSGDLLKEGEFNFRHHRFTMWVGGWVRRRKDPKEQI